MTSPVERSVDIIVPDIGDFKDVQIVEVLVKAGDVVKAEQPLIVVESDKATMDMPSPLSGSIVNVLLSVGDRISKGSLVAKAAPHAAAQSAAGLPVKRAPPAASAPLPPGKETIASEKAKDDKRFELAVIGGGPGGYSAAFRAADLGLNVVLIERYPTLGGVCLNVGCIPSKALLHIAAVKEEAERIADKGVRFSPPQIDLDALRAFKDGTIRKLTDGLSHMARARSVQIIQGCGKFDSPHSLEVTLATGATQNVAFEKAIIATGSSAVKLPFFPDDHRIVTSTGALGLDVIPRRMLVVGAGIIGLEMATVYSALGAKIDLIERLPEILAGVDRDAAKIWRSQNSHRFGRIDLNASVTGATVDTDGLSVETASTQTPLRSYDLVLQSVGRVPNSINLGLETIGVARDDKGFIAVDKQMRTNVPHLFAVGDVAGAPMLAHKAVHEAHVAAEAASGLASYFDAKIVPNVAYTDPEIAWVGIMEHEATVSGLRVKSAKFPWAASGRAIASGASYGMTKLVFDESTHRIVGGVIVGPHAGDMIGEICLAIEMGADALDLGKTIHPHPTLGETIGMAAEMYEGVCTDVLPARKP